MFLVRRKKIALQETISCPRCGESSSDDCWWWRR